MVACSLFEGFLVTALGEGCRSHLAALACLSRNLFGHGHVQLSDRSYLSRDERRMYIEAVIHGYGSRIGIGSIIF